VLRAAAIGRTPDGRPLLAAATRVAGPPLGLGHNSTQYDLSPDGRTIYFLYRQPGDLPREVGFVLGWRALVK
jgi:hypothetical protein